MFLDTSGLMCLFDSRDRRHTSAVERYSQAQARVTTNYVFTEFVALALARHAPLSLGLEFLDGISGSDEIDVVWVDKELHEQGLHLLRRRGDKIWSLCDAVSFVVMSERHLQTALTTDHHFEQAGYIRLLDQ